MPLRNGEPFNYKAHSCTDTLDAALTDPKGAMIALTNLIADPSTKDLWQCRPAWTLLTDFSTFNTPGFISCYYVYGNLVFGLIASAKNPGFDEPFCFNLTTNAFVAITGATSGNVPTSPPATGNWQPPIMDLIGTKLIVTHPGFPNGTNYFGWFDISTPTAPTWSAGNTGGTPLPSAPISVANFGGRAYYLCNPTNGQPAAFFSDVLVPLNLTNANQILTFGDNTPLTGAGKLQLSNVLGGVIQALIIFKGANGLWQITGDAATNNLSADLLPTNTGSVAPLSFANTPKGLVFMDTDGFRLCDFQGNVSDPMGTDGSGICVPFINAVVPSRVVAACNGKVLRASVQNGIAPGQANQEWWFDIARKVWFGPHTIAASLIEPWVGTFIATPVGVPAKLYRTDYLQSAASTFVELGVQMSYSYQTALLPDQGHMKEISVNETYVDMAFPAAGGAVNVNALDEFNSVLDSVNVNSTGNAIIYSNWGTFVWGTNVWGFTGTGTPLMPVPVSWHQPLVFSRASFQVNGNSGPGFKIGSLHLRYQELSYMPNP